MKTCASCKKLREEIVEALKRVDCNDWDSYKGDVQRPISGVLSDIASRLEALGQNETKR